MLIVILISDFFLKTNNMRRGSFWDYKKRKLLGAMELARNSWLSATNWRSELYLQVFLGMPPQRRLITSIVDTKFQT
jgi:hypothetical protein